MNTIVFTEEKKTYELAGTFNELTRKQIIRLAGIVNVKYDEAKKKFHILRVLFNVGSNPFATLLFRFKLKADHITDMFPAAEWALEEPSLTRQLIPSFRIPWSFKKLHGPDDNMKSLVFVEFIKAENEYNKFRKSGKLEHLDNLVAILYRPKKKTYNPKASDFDGDIREKYNDYNFKARAKQIRTLDLRVKMAIMMYFYGCRKAIIEMRQFKLVFTPEKKDKVEKSEGKYTWEDVLIDMAGEAWHVDDVSYGQLFTILLLINAKMKKNIEARKAMEKSKKG